MTAKPEFIETSTLSRGKGVSYVASAVQRALFRDNRTVWIIPVLGGSIPLEVHVSLRNMQWPMNTQRACLEMQNMEVGAAYEQGVYYALNAPQKFPFIWTYEQDNIQPPDVFLKLFAAIWTCIDCSEPITDLAAWKCANGHAGLDGVSGLYFIKTMPPVPMAFGDPHEGALGFRPFDVQGVDADVVEVNGIAMGCSLFRRGLFEKVTRPWFKTLSGSEPEKAGAFTQDLYFCKKAKEVGARFAVVKSCAVGHMDLTTGEIW